MTPPTDIASAPAATDGATRQYLTFCLGEQEFGVDILSVQEIRGYTAVTPIPNAPRHVAGVINLRGVVVPVIDLRTRFGLPAVEPTKFTVIVLLVVQRRVVGFIVDTVSDVVDIPASGIQETPDLGASGESVVSDFVRAGERLISLLDVPRVLDLDAAAPLAAGALGA